ncbi:MAG: amino acid permease [Ignavibacteriae bacterium]|nr:amino acid permease [Ignavibacteriota bacterium]
MKEKTRLKKEIGLLGVYAIATGTTLSAGFFLLPGLAAISAGEALVLAYIIAAIPLIPSMFSIIELATAMPKAGGVYYFLDRTMGPFVGTIGGVGTYLALVLKVAFALIGMGAYIALFFPTLEIIPIAIVIAVILGVLNIFGAKKTGKLQIFLVVGLLSILAIFVGGGIPSVDYGRLNNIFNFDFSSLIGTAGLVYISYVGVTKVASLSEEVKNPERNLPLGILLAMGTAILVYALGTSVMVGVLPIEKLAGNLTPVASAAEVFLGKGGVYILSVAALFAFLSVANAGTLSASRYPLAMSRDHILPEFFGKLSRQGTPVLSIVITVGVIVLFLVAFDPTGIAKLASAFQLLIFAFLCLAVIVMRESKIDSYDPGYKSPLYPWMQLFGIVTSFVLIGYMGILPIIFSTGLLLLGATWYWYYAKNKVVRRGAIYHVFERWGRARYDGIDTELRGILKEKGLREDDPFDDIVHRSAVVELTEKTDFENLVKKVSKILTYTTKLTEEEIELRIMEGTRVGATPVTHSVALPHFRCENIDHAEMVLVKSNPGISIEVFDPLTHEVEETKIVHGIFFLVSPESDPTQHLRILAKIAGRVDDEDFADKWKNSKNEHDVQEALLYDEQFLTIIIKEKGNAKELVNTEIRSMYIPEGCLITTIKRGGQILIPKGNTMLKDRDRIIIMGDVNGIDDLRKRYT